MSLEKDYLIDNLLTQIDTLEKRIAALERRGPDGGQNMNAPATGAAPEGVLPSPDDIAPWYIRERTTGDLYEAVCEIMAGRAKLLLRRIGPMQGGG